MRLHERKNFHRGHGLKGLAGPHSGLAGVLPGSSPSPGHVRVTTLLHVLPGLSLCGFLPPLNSAIWLVPESLGTSGALCTVQTGYRQTGKEPENMRKAEVKEDLVG